MTSLKPRRSAAWNRALGAVNSCGAGFIIHNVRIGARRTSFRLDAVTWNALDEIAAREGITRHELCTTIADSKPRALSMTAALRCYIIGYFHEAG
jgi:predicted DNA-binding ribbon-helix-helix protein